MDVADIVRLMVILSLGNVTLSKPTPQYVHRLSRNALRVRLLKFNPLYHSATFLSKRLNASYAVIVLKPVVPSPFMDLMKNSAECSIMPFFMYTVSFLPCAQSQILPRPIPAIAEASTLSTCAVSCAIWISNIEGSTLPYFNCSASDIDWISFVVFATMFVAAISYVTAAPLESIPKSILAHSVLLASVFR